MRKTKKPRRPVRAGTMNPSHLSDLALRRIWESGIAGSLDPEVLRRPEMDPNFAVDGMPLLVIAAEGGHESVVSLLLSHPRIDPNLHLENGTTALLLAAQNGYTAVVGALLAHPQTDPNRGTHHEGVTPLFIAAQNGHLEVVQALLAHDQIDTTLAVEGCDAATMAVACGFDNIAEAISMHHLQSGAMELAH